MAQAPNSERSAATVRTLELIVGAWVFVFGLAVLYDSWRLGAQWGDDGPQAGYFPFYIGLLILISSGAIIVRALRASRAHEKSFVSVGQLRMVLMLLVPSIIYVGAIHLVGIYIASILFIAFFMIWLGKYSIAKSAVVSIAVMVAFFLIFEVWFNVPLPKGPLEAMLGLN
jgi:putative tricarboxylic transport membrane protein